MADTNVCDSHGSICIYLKQCDVFHANNNTYRLVEAADRDDDFFGIPNRVGD